METYPAPAPSSLRSGLIAVVGVVSYFFALSACHPAKQSSKMKAVALPVVATSTEEAAPSEMITTPQSPMADARKHSRTTYAELSERERAVFETLAFEDLSGFAEGRIAVGLRRAFDPPIQATADRLQADYERNEVAGDLKYRGKNLLLRGVVRSIDRSIGENYVLALSAASSQFLGVHAMMADGFTPYLASLEKGQQVILFCEGGGMMMGSAMVTSCRPSDAWVQEQFDALVSSMNQDGDYSRMVNLLLVVSVFVADTTENLDVCLSKNAFRKPECMSVVKKVMKRLPKMPEQEMRDTILKRLGIDAATLFAA